MKLTLRLLALLGILLYGCLFAFSFGVPDAIERAGAEFIKERIGIETRKQVESLTDAAGESKLGRLAQKMLESQKARVQQLKEILQQRAEAKIADVVAEMSNGNCECRRRIAEMLANNLHIELSLANMAVSKIEEFLRTQYSTISQKLITDLRIFLGANLAAFVLLLGVSLLKPQAVVQLFVPGLLLVLSVLICSYFYVFQQNWFLTIIYGNYIGLFYLVWLGSVFVLLCDIALNRARICTSIVKSGVRMVGSSIDLSPC